MQGTLSIRGKTAVSIAAFAACCALGASLLAGGAGATGAAKDFSFDCDHDATHVTQTGNRLDARGRLRCTGSGIRREVVRVCLLQASLRGPVVVKCVRRARSGTGLVSAVASRRCGKGPDVGFITRLQVRIRLTNGDVVTDTARSSPNRFPRDCV